MLYELSQRFRKGLAVRWSKRLLRAAGCITAGVNVCETNHRFCEFGKRQQMLCRHVLRVWNHACCALFVTHVDEFENDRNRVHGQDGYSAVLNRKHLEAK
jgi:hypothetical protein